MTAPPLFIHLDDEAALLAAYDVVAELRPHLHGATAFADQVLRQRQQGYRLLAAYVDDTVCGLAGYRLQENLLYGRFVYVDDLIVTARLQRSGLGAELLRAVRQIATGLDCAHFVLDTGLHMALAQRFYYRQGLLAKGLHFVESLTPVEPTPPVEEAACAHYC